MAYLTRTLAASAARGIRTTIDRGIDGIGVVPLAVWGILGLALSLRLAVVGFGLPQELDPDEETFVEPALRMVRERTFDPSWYGNPASTLLDVLAALYAAHGIIGVLTGATDQVASVYRDYREDVSHYFMVGRIYTALAGVAAVVVVYAIARELRISTLWSSVAALLVAVTGSMIVYSTTIRSDMVQILFLLLIVYVMTRALTRPTAASFGLAGACLGLAVASKYPGLVGVVPILAAVGTLVSERKVRVGRALMWLGLAAATSVIAAFVVGPYLFLSFQAVLADVAYEARGEHLGAAGLGFLPGMWAYLTEALPAALGWIGTGLAVAGTGVMLADRRARPAALLFGGFIDEYRAERDAYPCEAAVYEDLLAMYPVVETFDREDASLGGPILVLDANPEGSGNAAARAASGWVR